MDRSVDSGPVKDLCFCGNDRMLLTGGLDCVPVLWDVEQETRVHAFPKHGASIQAVAASRKGDIFATGAFSPDPIIRLYDGAAYHEFGELKGHTTAVRGVQLLHAGKIVASAGGDRTVRLWDVSTQQQRFVFDQDTSIFASLEASPDERILAAGAFDGTLRFYRAASPEDVLAEPGWSRVTDSE